MSKYILLLQWDRWQQMTGSLIKKIPGGGKLHFQLQITQTDGVETHYSLRGGNSSRDAKQFYEMYCSRER